MFKLKPRSLLAAAIFGSLIMPTAPAISAPVAAPNWAANEVIVKFKGPLLSQTVPADAAPQAALTDDARAVLSQINGEVMRFHPSLGLAHIKYSGNQRVDEIIAELQQSAAVEYAEPNYRLRSLVRSQAADRANTTANAQPNDPRFSEQWALDNNGQTGGQTDADIDAVEAWNTRTDASSTIVAVLGTGIDYTHSDLKSNMWKNPGETSCTDRVDNDRNGYIDDCYGIDAYLNSGDPMDDNGSGTHMAGIVGAQGNNSKGTTGVAWKAQLMGLRFLDADGWGWSADAIQCLDYAARIKDKYGYTRMVVLADSMGGRYSKALYDMLATVQAKGILVVAGSGDGDADTDVWARYPGTYNLTHIVNVSASDRNDYRMSAGYGGRGVDLGAPGDNILSTWLADNYKLANGTSAAAAFTAGSAALVWSQNPGFNWKQVKGALLNGAEDGLHGTFYYGYNSTEGRLNAANSLQSEVAARPAIFSITPDVTTANETITLSGINFGNSKGSVQFAGVEYPSSAILSWSNESIVIKVPETSPIGYNRMAVKSSVGTSRTAFFRVHSPNDEEWIYPTYRGTTLLEHEEAAYAQINNDLWIISGRSNYGQTTYAVEKFSLLTLRGEVRPEWEIPKAVRQAGAAAIGNKIYVVGGYDDASAKYQSALQIFDTVSGTWSRGRNLPQALGQASVVAVGNQLWVFGGHDPNNTGLKTAYLYTPAKDTWTTKAALPLKRAYAGVATPQAGKVWLVSGYTESGGTWYRTKDMLEYNIATNSWTIRDDIPQIGEHPGGGVINIGSKVFSIYGDGDWSAGEWISPTSKKWVRNIAWNSWTGSYTPMLGKIGNSVFIVSGSRGREVYQFQSP